MPELDELQTAAWAQFEADLDDYMAEWEKSLRKSMAGAVRESKDASGHEHKGKGAGGGQFTGSGGGGAATASAKSGGSSGAHPGAARKTVDKVKDIAVARFQKMQERYGRKGAIVVMAATIAMTPIPLPGTSLVPIAIAEAVVAMHKLFKGPAAVAESRESEPSTDDLLKAVRELLTDLYSEAGEEAPELDEAAVRKAIEEQP